MTSLKRAVSKNYYTPHLAFFNIWLIRQRYYGKTINCLANAYSLTHSPTSGTMSRRSVVPFASKIHAMKGLKEP